MSTTLVILKPDAVQRKLVGKIVSRFENAGMEIQEMVMATPIRSDWNHHYETIGKVGTRHGQGVLQSLITFMVEGPVVFLLIGGPDVVETVRKMIGTTEPKLALPGTIRGDFACDSWSCSKSRNDAIRNLIHASATTEEAELEIAHWAPKLFVPLMLRVGHAVDEKDVRLEKM
jgi:nucleoside-diphosphate kinase